MTSMFSPLIQRFIHVLKPEPTIVPSVSETFSKEETMESLQTFKETIYDCLKTIKDPEKPATLEDLEVITEESISVTQPFKNSTFLIKVEFNPTVPHCSLATLIGLCIRVKLLKNFSEKIKLDIFVKQGSHDIEEEVNKQINDKERVAAALENPALRDLVEKCIIEED